MTHSKSQPRNKPNKMVGNLWRRPGKNFRTKMTSLKSYSGSRLLAMMKLSIPSSTRVQKLGTSLKRK
jgi:hypothetical protein